MSDEPKKPAAFRLDRRDIDIAEPSDMPVPTRTGAVAEDEIAPPSPSAPTSRWAKLFWAGLGMLVSLAFTVFAAQLIDDLFRLDGWLGWVGLAALGLFLVAGLVLLGREIISLRRLARFDRLRERAEQALATRDDRAAAAVAGDLVAALAANPRTAKGRARFAEAITEGIVDGPQRLRIVEREVLEPLDREATRLVAEAARRVSVVTAVSPRALIDLAVVFGTAVQLVRRLAELYGGRPGTLGMLKLTRHVLTHMALTGGMAAGDTVLDQLLGAGLASKLSAKLGEGVLNGLLTARLGVTAIAVTRPLPYIQSARPDLRDLAGDALSLSATKPERDRTGGPNG